jgi:hypothetical protein
MKKSSKSEWEGSAGIGDKGSLTLTKNKRVTDGWIEGHGDDVVWE